MLFVDFTNDQSSASAPELKFEEWPVLVPTGGNKAFFMLDCCVSNFGQDLWLINAFGWSKLNESVPTWIDEAVDEDATQNLDCSRKCVCSDNVLFWVDSESNLRMKRVGLLSLQYLCLETLITFNPLMKTFDEREAKNFGVPVKVWQRFVGTPHIKNSSVETVITIE